MKLANFNKLKPTEKILLIGLVTVVAASLYIQAIHKPLLSSITRFRSQIEKSQVRLNDLRLKFPDIEKQKQNIQSLESDCKSFSEEIEGIEKRLPAMENTSQLIGEFTRRAKGLGLASIRQKIERGDEYSRMIVELRFIAPYEKTINYIKNLESVSPFLAIDELEISEEKEMRKEGSLMVRMVVSTLLGGGRFSEGFLKSEETKELIRLPRDIFVSKTRPAAKTGKQELKLEGITFNLKSPTAIINGEVVRVDTKIENLTVKQILADAVILSDGIEEHILSMER